MRVHGPLGYIELLNFPPLQCLLGRKCPAVHSGEDRRHGILGERFRARGLGFRAWGIRVLGFRACGEVLS